MWNILNVYMLSKRVVHKFFKFQLKYGLKLFRDETHADDDLLFLFVAVAPFVSASPLADLCST